LQNYSDPQAEQAILGVLLNNPEEALTICRAEGLHKGAFFVARNAALFGEISSRLAEHKPIDWVTMGRTMEPKGWPQAELSQLWLESGSASMLSHWARLVLEAERTRRLTEVLKIAFEQAGSTSTSLVLAEARAALDRLAEGGARKSREQSVETLMAFDREKDEDWLLGDNRWLCRGGSLMVAGSTGAGKSSLNLQLAIGWALHDYLDDVTRYVLTFGIPSKIPIRSLIIQAENDDGDMAETLQGILQKFPPVQTRLTERAIAALADRLKIVRENETAGAEFLGVVADLVTRHKPHICWIDPIMNFLGGDMSDQATVSDFCNGLNKISNRTGVIFALINHIPKPTKDAKGGAYGAYGSSAWSNWAREVLSLERMETPDGQSPTFKLSATKRRLRAGLIGWDQKVAAEVYIRHNPKARETGNVWLACPKPEPEEEEQPAKKWRRK